MSVGRRGPLSFLDTEWRTALWKRWVATHLVNGTDDRGLAAGETPIAVAPTPTGNASEPTSAAAHDGPVTSNDVLEAAQAVARRPAPSADGRNERRADVRARFDALSERLQ